MEDPRQAETMTLRLRLVQAGFVPLPLYGKEPPIFGKNNKRKGLAGWEKLDGVTREQIEMWRRTWPDAGNTGVLTKQMPTLDIDITNEEAVRAIEEYVREHHEERGHILPRIGMPPKRAIPFRTDEPFAKIVANVVAPNGGAEKIEFLADGQQVVVAGIHPDTQQVYRWHGGEPGQIARNDLPYIREEEAQHLVDKIVELLVRDFSYRRAAERPRKRRKGNGNDIDIDAAAGVSGGADDWQWLLDNIHKGHELHASLRDLAAKLIASGMSAGAAVNFLRAQINASNAPRDDRFQDRYNNIPRLVESAEDLCREKDEPAAPPAPACALTEVHATFKKWLGEEYDIATLDAVLAVLAAEKLNGDPPWLLLISGPGNAKTETIQAASGVDGAHIISTIASEGALLSATAKKSRAKTATGGLLRKIGDRGILIIKDFTSILSADRNVRTAVLAALREVYDGRWERNVGSDGGQTLSWQGRVVVVGACTTAWDSAHAVVATMGDRFVQIRSSSYTGRQAAYVRAIDGTGSEVAMRQELADAVAGLIGTVDKGDYPLTKEEKARIGRAADLVTLARTAIETDYRGDIIDAHDPEMPTRFAKQLVQIMRGAVAIGMTRADALVLVVRCARNSMPQLRLDVLEDIAANPDSRIIDVRRRLQRPWRSIDRTLEGLYMLRLLTCYENEEERGGKLVYVRHYALAGSVALDVLKSNPSAEK
jgi:Bifunctional DNA primase/polymerase, N-terminal